MKKEKIHRNHKRILLKFNVYLGCKYKRSKIFKKHMYDLEEYKNGGVKEWENERMGERKKKEREEIKREFFNKGIWWLTLSAFQVATFTKFNAFINNLILSALFERKCDIFFRLLHILPDMCANMKPLLLLFCWIK